MTTEWSPNFRLVSDPFLLCDASNVRMSLLSVVPLTDQLFLVHFSSSRPSSRAADEDFQASSFKGSITC
eukprot:750889-Hanusia_phi.AAC.2